MAAHVFFDHFVTAYGICDGQYVAGTSISHVDTSLFQLVAGLRYAFPNRMAAVESDYPCLIGCSNAVSTIEGIAAYLASDRRIAFNEDGIFRHYEDLDPA